MADSSAMSDERRRLDEIIALESIFIEEEIKRSEEHGPSTGQFYAYVTVPEDFQVINKHQESNCKNLLTVVFLPPIVLHYSLPEGYPSDPKSPPSFTLTCHWLNRGQLTKLCKRLDSLWKENHVDEQGAEILYTWAQFLKSESLEFLKINNSLDISQIENVHRSKYVFKQLKTPSSQMPEPGVGNPVAENLHVEETPTSQPPPTSKVGWTVKEPSGGSSSWSCFQTVSKTNEGCSKPIQEKSETTTVEGANKPIHQELAISQRMLDCRAVVDLSINTATLEEFLDAHDKTRKDAEFRRQFHCCDICFETKLGSHFTKFVPCNHIFCSECAIAYFSTCINDGKVQNIACPGDKCNSEAHFNQIKELVGTELFLKYDRLLLNATLDGLGDLIVCPRATCQYLVTRDGDDKLATCFQCRYAFCVECRMGYHGVEPCRFKVEEQHQLTEEYQNANAQRRAELEKRYSKRRLEELVQNSMTQVWMEDNSKSCPHCKVSIQKSFGCNKMICWKCNTNFCWLCCAKLDPMFPYLHFNKVGSKCYNLLFHGIETNNDELEENEGFDELDGLIQVEQAELFEIIDHFVQLNHIVDLI